MYFQVYRRLYCVYNHRPVCYEYAEGDICAEAEESCIFMLIIRAFSRLKTRLTSEEHADAQYLALKLKNIFRSMLFMYH